jgi:hypothetical protein
VRALLHDGLADYSHSRAEEAARTGLIIVGNAADILKLEMPQLDDFRKRLGPGLL